MARRRLACGLALGISMAWTTGTGAQEPSPGGDSEPPVASPSASTTDTPDSPQSLAAGEPVIEYERIWYGPTVMLLYGIAYAAGTGGYFLARRENAAGVRAGGTILMSAGALTGLVGVPIVHWSHGSLARGWISFGGQVGATLAGLGVGAGVAAASNTEDPATPRLVGALAGHFTWAVVDAVVVAREKRIVSITTPAARLRPTLTPTDGGFMAGAVVRY